MELLHSREHLQAILQFVAHIQALCEEEHQLLGRPMTTGTQQGLQHDPPADVSITCQVLQHAACNAARSILPWRRAHAALAGGTLPHWSAGVGGAAHASVHTVFCSSQDARGCLDDCAVPPETRHLLCCFAGKFTSYACLYVPLLLTVPKLVHYLDACIAERATCRTRLTPLSRFIAKPPSSTQMFQRACCTSMR